ncbi:MAG: TlpA family protein disulfide reductase [Actinomycetota bacterium]
MRPRRPPRSSVRWFALFSAIGIVVFSVAIALAISGTDDSTPADAPGSASDATTDEFELLDGGRASLADYRGKPVVANFFASWCTACLAELPRFEAIHQDHKDEVQFLGINLQDSDAAARNLIADTGITYDIARDPNGTLFQSFGALAMPTTVFLDADGRVVELHSGDLSAEQLEATITEKLLR